MAATTEAAIAPRDPGRVFGHPRGLLVLAGTEFWDRFSFAGLQALLTLYMVDQLLLPGHVEKVAGFAGFRAAVEGVTGPLSTQALAVQIFGLYMGLAQFTPIIGGALGDRVLGRRTAVVLGGLFMAAGHAAMAFDRSFLLALLFMTLGNGLFVPNLAPQVGDLYSRDDRRRAVAFQIYAAAVSGGAFLAPLVMGSVAQASYHLSFTIAAVGMIVGLTVYLSGQRVLPPQTRTAAAKAARLTAREWRVVALLIALVPLSSTFWISQSQIWNTYNIWVRDHVELMVGGFKVPVPWLQSLDSLAPFLALPPMLMFWAWQARRGREPDEFGKAGVGCFIFAAGTLWLAAAQFFTGSDGRTPLIWAVVFHIVSNLGWLYFAPTCRSLLSRYSPIAVTGTIMALYSLAVSLGSVISGRLGGLYAALEPWQFWGLHAAITATGGAVFLALGGVCRRMVAAEEAA